MLIAFAVAATVAVAATALMVSSRHPVHALLDLILSLLAVAVIFYLLGAPLAAALEVIVYAGAIMVLFLFVVMLLDLGRVAEEAQAALEPRALRVPVLLAAVLIAEVMSLLVQAPSGAGGRQVGAAAVGGALFGPYLIAVELAALLLLAGLVAAVHVGRREDAGDTRGSGS